MSYMSTLATAGISVEEMAAYLKDHPGIAFDEAVWVIRQRHTNDKPIPATMKGEDEMTRIEVLKTFCELAADVMKRKFNYEIPADCFCGGYNDESFQFHPEIMEFIVAAINEKLECTASPPDEVVRKGELLLRDPRVSPEMKMLIRGELNNHKQLNGLFKQEGRAGL